MLRNDEIIALNALMFAERWRLHPWLDIRWDEVSGSYSTYILHSSYDTVEDEAECEISSLEDLNVLLATDAEFYRNVTTLISIGALEAYDVEVEFLIQVIVDRITGVESKTPYGYSMVAGVFKPTENHIYSFDEKEAEQASLLWNLSRLSARPVIGGVRLLKSSIWIGSGQTGRTDMFLLRINISQRGLGLRMCIVSLAMNLCRSRRKICLYWLSLLRILFLMSRHDSW